MPDSNFRPPSVLKTCTIGPIQSGHAAGMSYPTPTSTAGLVTSMRDGAGVTNAVGMEAWPTPTPAWKYRSSNSCGSRYAATLAMTNSDLDDPIGVLSRHTTPVIPTSPRLLRATPASTSPLGPLYWSSP